MSVYVDIYIYMYVCMYIYMYLFIHTYIYIYEDIAKGPSCQVVSCSSQGCPQVQTQET